MLRNPLLGAAALAACIALVPDASAAPVQCVPTPKVGAEQQIFKDVLPGSLGEDEAVALKNDGIPVECWSSPLMFCPDCTITRAQLMLFLVAASNIALLNPSTPTFTDVPTTSPYYQYVETAVSKGWTGGCAPGLFCPEEPVTRAQAAVFISIAAGLPNATPVTPSYTDLAASSPFYKFAEGLKNKCAGAGCSPTAFCPDAGLARKEAAVLVARAFDIWTLGSCIAYSTAADAGVDGAAGSGGSESDAAAGAGGSTGGTGGASGSGGSGGSGGLAGSASGGSSGSGGSAGSSGSASQASQDDGGCGCRAPRSTRAGDVTLLAALFGLLFARRRFNRSNGEGLRFGAPGRVKRVLVQRPSRRSEVAQSWQRP
jgi:hypothetical protein